MSPTLAGKQNKDSRILILSQRRYSNFIYNSCLYEFEDAIERIDKVDIITIEPENIISKYTQKLIKHSSRIIPQCIDMTPLGLKSYSLNQDYDLLLVIVDFPWNFFWINLLKQWQTRCAVTVCYLIEIWQHDLDRFKNHLKFFENFDLVFLGHSQIVDSASNILNRTCQYLPPGIDTLKFKPNFNDNYRCIDVCSMGRRSEVTHQALLKLAEKQNFFYHYDSTGNSNLRIVNHQTHRTLNANILKNSRYFITNNAKVNLPQQIANQTEIGYRFFEGAASGTVMLGCPPRNDAFKKYFNWQDAVIPMAFDEPNIAEVIADLDAQPQRLEKIRQENIVNSLLRHDWVYRWQEILAKTGLKLTSETIERQNYLQELARSLQILSVNRY